MEGSSAARQTSITVTVYAVGGGVRRRAGTAASHPRPHRRGDQAGAGSAEQIAERFAEILEPGLTDYIVLQSRSAT